MVRCLLDTDAQRSYVTTSLVNRLKPKRIRKEKVTHGLFGGTETKPMKHCVYRVSLLSLMKDFKCTAEVLEQPRICGAVVPLSSEEMRDLLLYEDIALAYHEGALEAIEMLLGADMLAKIMAGAPRETRSGLLAVPTKLGWSVMGRSDYEESHDTVLNVMSLHAKEMKTTELWSLDVLGIKDPIQTATTKTRQTDLLKRFRETIKVLKGGRYQVDLPFKEGHAALPSYKAMAWKRHQSMMQRLNRNGLLQEYQNIFDDWEEKRIIERIPSHQLSESGCYLPHRPVVKTGSSTTKIRPIFDASAKEKGWNLIEDIPDMLDRFRRNSVGVTADIEKAFLQLEVNSDHRDFLRFFNPNGLEYRHRRVVFGVTSSPFLLGASFG